MLGIRYCVLGCQVVGIRHIVYRVSGIKSVAYWVLHVRSLYSMVKMLPDHLSGCRDANNLPMNNNKCR